MLNSLHEVIQVGIDGAGFDTGHCDFWNYAQAFTKQCLWGRGEVSSTLTMGSILWMLDFRYLYKVSESSLSAELDISLKLWIKLEIWESLM